MNALARGLVRIGPLEPEHESRPSGVAPRRGPTAAGSGGVERQRRLDSGTRLQRLPAVAGARDPMAQRISGRGRRSQRGKAYCRCPSSPSCPSGSAAYWRYWSSL